MQPLPVLQKHQPAISTSQTFLRGPSVTGGSPNSTSESYLDEGDDVQERTSMSGYVGRIIGGSDTSSLQGNRDRGGAARPVQALPALKIKPECSMFFCCVAAIFLVTRYTQLNMYRA